MKILGDPNAFIDELRPCSIQCFYDFFTQSARLHISTRLLWFLGQNSLLFDPTWYPPSVSQIGIPQQLVLITRTSSDDLRHRSQLWEERCGIWGLPGVPDGWGRVVQVSRGCSRSYWYILYSRRSHDWMELDLYFNPYITMHVPPTPITCRP